MSFIQWWYGEGWRQQMRQTSVRLEGTIDYFSITLLLKTLFQPYRQISAGTVDGSIDAKLRAWFDRLVSRMIGAVVRMVIILAGVVTITLHLLLGLIILLAWAIVPVLPIIGVVMAALGWTL